MERYSFWRGEGGHCSHSSCWMHLFAAAPSKDTRSEDTLYDGCTGTAPGDAFMNCAMSTPPHSSTPSFLRREASPLLFTPTLATRASPRSCFRSVG